MLHGLFVIHCTNYILDIFSVCYCNNVVAGYNNSYEYIMLTQET